jgi:hypothetical protein
MQKSIDSDKNKIKFLLMSSDGKEPKRGSMQSFFRSSFKKKEG